MNVKLVQGYRTDTDEDIVETLDTLAAAMRDNRVEVKIYPELLEDAVEEINELRLEADLLRLQVAQFESKSSDNLPY